MIREPKNIQNWQVPMQNPNIPMSQLGSNNIQSLQYRPYRKRRVNRDIIVGEVEEPVYVQQVYPQQVPVQQQPRLRQKKQSKAMYKLKSISMFGCLGVYTGILGFSNAVRSVMGTFASGIFLIANNNAPTTFKEGALLVFYGIVCFILILPIGAFFSFAMSYNRLSKGNNQLNSKNKQKRRPF